MYSLEIIKNIEKQSFFKKAKNIKNNISKIKKIKILDLEIKTSFAALANYFSFLYISNAIIKIAENPELAITGYFCCAFVFGVLNGVSCLLFHLLHDTYDWIFTYKINKIYKFKPALSYNLKEIINTTKIIDCAEKNTIELLTLTKNIDLNNIEDVTYVLLINKIQNSSYTNIVNEKENIIKKNQPYIVINLIHEIFI